MAGDGKKVVILCYATMTEQLSFREFANDMATSLTPSK